MSVQQELACVDQQPHLGFDYIHRKRRSDFVTDIHQTLAGV
jgi:hypothetical protein